MSERYKKRIGIFGENLAKNFLIRRGYEIISSNVKLSYLEIDIIAREKNEIVFVEVKTRAYGNLGSADEALTACQTKNLKRAISMYCGQKKLNINNVRLDFISVDIDRENKKAKIKHYKEIF